MSSSAAIGHAAMLLFSALVAGSFTFGSLVANDIAPEALTLIRFAIATVTLGMVSVALKINWQKFVGQTWRWLIIGGCMAAYFILMFEALRLTTPLATSAVFTFTPLMAAGFGLLLISTRVGPTTLFALLIGAFGALWVIFRGDLDRAISLDVGKGEALFFIGAVTHALVPALTRRLVPGASAFEAALGTVVGALVLTAIYSLPATLALDLSKLSSNVWLVALYLGIVTTAVTFFLLQTAIARIPPGKVMAYTYLVPSWVVLHGIFLGHAENAIVYVGVAMTFVALLILLFSKDVRT